MNDTMWDRLALFDGARAAGSATEARTNRIDVTAVPVDGDSRRAGRLSFSDVHLSSF